MGLSPFEAIMPQALNQFLEFSPQSVAIFDTEMRYLVANPRWYEGYGIVGKDIIGKSHYEVFPEITQHWKDIHQKCLQGAVMSEEADPFPRADGKTDYVKWMVRPWYQADGTTIGGLIMYTEVITEQILHQKARRKYEARYEALTKGNPAFVLFIDRYGNIEEINHLPDDQRDQIIGVPYAMLIAADPYATYIERQSALLMDTLATGKTHSFLGRGASQKGDGGIAYYDSRIMPVHEDGDIVGAVVIATDVTAELLHQARFEGIVEAIPELVFRFTPDAVYSYIKPSKQLIDKPENLLGKQVADVIPGELGQKFRRAIQAVAKTGISDAFEYDLQVPVGFLNFEARLFPVEGEVLVVVRDITDMKEAQRKLEESIRELNHSLLFKDQFLATMSHELRTPMNAIMGYSSLAVELPNLEPKVKNMFERILINSRRLLNLINDILDISRINAGRIEIVNDAFDLHELVRGWEKDYAQSANKKGLQFVCELDPTVPIDVTGDSERLTQIVGNLVTNAVKFTDIGSVTLSVRPNADDDTKLDIVVADTGIGISDTWHHLIFEEFRQVEMGSERNYGGAGLGLSIVQKLCILMGGTVTVASKVGEGSTFTVTLPITRKDTNQGEGE
jgi:PAS domain S-box-containing protein